MPWETSGGVELGLVVFDQLRADTREFYFTFSELFTLGSSPKLPSFLLTAILAKAYALLHSPYICPMPTCAWNPSPVLKCAPVKAPPRTATFAPQGLACCLSLTNLPVLSA